MLKTPNQFRSNIQIAFDAKHNICSISNEAIYFNVQQQKNKTKQCMIKISRCLNNDSMLNTIESNHLMITVKNMFVSS